MSNDLDFAYRLYYDYSNYAEQNLTHKRFRHSDILPLINNLIKSKIFSVAEAGRSVMGREIFLIKAGWGDTKIFLWSQMHGDESTATMAIFDLFNFFMFSDGFNDFKNNLFARTTIYFMPMVNPDGAELFQRRNIFDIDLNRDFVQLQSPEAKILKDTFEKIKPDFGFNLHDQSKLYSAGHNFKPATLSFLAPPIDEENTIDNVRAISMKLIGKIFNTMSSFIPGHIAKYNDEYEPRAFGDNFQKLGASTILIESGGWNDDPEKQFIRKLNFISLLSAFKYIEEGSFANEPLETYESIPVNQKDLLDVVLRNLKIRKNGFEYFIDIGIIKNEFMDPASSKYFVKSSIEEIGDLSVYFGYEDIDLSGMEILPGKTFPEEFLSIDEVENLDFNSLHLKGYTNVLLNDKRFSLSYSPFPVNIITNKSLYSDEIKIEKAANMIITKDSVVTYVIINGFLIETAVRSEKRINGMVY